MKIISAITLLLTGSLLFGTEPTFMRHDIGTFTQATDLCITDINNDGFQDIVATAYEEGIAWWQNDGQQNFTKHIIADTTYHSGARSVRAALDNGTKLDFNNDGFVDLVTAAMFGNRASVWINDGNGNFSEVLLDSISIGSHTVDVEDLDGDGDTDILIAAMGTLWYGVNAEFAIYYNNGNLQFTKEVLSSTANMPTFIYTADLDNNGDKDILFAEYGSGQLGWYKWNNNSYERIILDTVTGMHTAQAKDYDQDGDLDILATAYNGRKLFIWQNDGAGNFSKVWEYQCMGGIWLDIADFDNDGDYDLVGAAQNPGVSADLFWFKNNGNNNFTATQLISNLREVYCAKPADLDNDGDQDIIIAVNADNKLIWWENVYTTGIDENSLGTDNSLLQNYPNPFNPKSKIKYQISETGMVELAVYDMLGRKISTLVNEYKPTGIYEVEFDGQNMTSGTYFYTLAIGNQLTSRKMILLK